MSAFVKIYPNAKNKKVKHYTLDRPFLELVMGGVNVRQATEQGFAFCKMGGCFDTAYVNSTIRRARVQEEGRVSGAIMSCVTTYCIIREHEI